MIYDIEIPTNIIQNSINVALSKPLESRGNFFHEIRAAFKKNLEAIFETNGLVTKPNETLGYTHFLRHGVHVRWYPIIKYTGWNNDIRQELDLEFCIRCGHDDYSLSAINYIDRTPCHLPALSSLSGVISLGNILILVENKNCEFNLTLGDGIFATGYAYHISKRKKKSYVCLLGVWFRPELIDVIIQSKLMGYEDSKQDLDEIMLGTIRYPVLYINRVTGDLVTCSCFAEYFDVSRDIERFLPFGNSEDGLKNRVKIIKTMDRVCHFCCGGIPKHEYGHSMYYSSFMQKYLPYHQLLSRMTFGKDIYEEDEGYRLVENKLREKFGYPKVGERWVAETTLYKIVSSLFPKHEVIHHYRGAELEGLELDIWLPDWKIGLEYQGVQHYKVIEHWGGKEGLEKRVANDHKKKQLCKKLGYHLVEFRYSEELSANQVRKKLANIISFD